ncbi:MAG: hypothetical protein HQL37_09770 [Alphaproteobacteria bacterium]|nr:hypothetical protein [Alphaproteobacteria bacterium]
MTSAADPTARLSGPPAAPWHLEALGALRERLRAWPAVLPQEIGDPIVPLELEVEMRLLGRLAVPDLDGIMLIKTTIQRYCNSGQYLAALARDGALRHDLRGRPVEPVSVRDRAVALEALDKARRLTLRHAPPPTTETIMVTVKALKITAVLPAEQLAPTEASAVQLTLATPDGAKATARITGKAYRRVLTQIAALGPEQAVVVLQGSIRKPGEIEGAGLSVQARKTKAEDSGSETDTSAGSEGAQPSFDQVPVGSRTETFGQEIHKGPDLG